jgi:YidC/Oxa1 family membrane protein insertase
VDRNLLLACALSFLVLVGWQSFFPQPTRDLWQPEQARPGVEAPLTQPAASDGELRRAAPEAGRVVSDAEIPVGSEEVFAVRTEHYRTEVTSRGAALTGWELAAFHSGVDHGSEPIQLLAVQDGVSSRIVTPLTELGLGDLSDAPFRAEQISAREFKFEFSKSGVSVRKQYSFNDADYGFRMSIEIENRSERPLQPEFASAWEVGWQSIPDFKELALTGLRAGAPEMHPIAGVGVAGFFSQATPKIVLRGDVEWAGLQTPYFLGALAPDHATSAVAVIDALEPGRRARVSIGFEPVTIPSGTTALHEFKGYFGPKEEARLIAAGSNFARSIDLGWSWVSPLTHFFGWLLNALHSLIPNYGIAIILITVLVRIATLPLTNRQMRSMERMRALQPKQLEIQQKFANDRQKQSEALMELYRREKVNPMGGCLPMLLQLPVFVGLYYALRSSIELRQAPFFGWINDLSQPEEIFKIPGLDLPVRVLPLLMGASMVVQQKLTPTASMDPAQARMMLVLMPVMMTFMFYQFPSGLVLYWMISNVLAIAHQRWIGSRLNTQQAV